MKGNIIPNISDENLAEYVNIQKNIMNEKRLRILVLLNNESQTWSQFMQELDLRNPKLLHDHISMLISLNLIKKDEQGFYTLTKTGKLFIDLNLSQMKKMSGHLGE